MPRYYEDKPDGGACAGVKEDLGACLLQSDCVLQVAQSAAANAGKGRPARGRGWRKMSWSFAVAVRTCDSELLVLGADYNSDLIDLGIATVGTSVPSGFKLEIKIPPRWIFVTNHFS